MDALIPKTRQKILAAAYLDPQRWWFMRELARHLRVSPSSLQRELGSLVKGGTLVRKRSGKHVYFQAAAESPVFEELRALILKTFGLADVLRDALGPFAGHIRWAFIYGSMARSEEHAASDVDLMIIGNVSLAALSGALRAAERNLGRAVNPAIYTPQDFAVRLKARHNFAVAAIRARKIFVMGDPVEFVRTFGEQAPAAPSAQRK